MSDPEKSDNIPDESAGKGKGVSNGGNPAKTKEVNLSADASDKCSNTFLLFCHTFLKCMCEFCCFT